MAGRKIRDAHEARSCLDAAESSGVPRADWAREHGIDGRSLHAWHMNLARRASEPTPLRLVELVPSAPSAATPCVRVRCGPFLVEVGADFDDRTLVRVLAAVAAC
jgi:hypothetical protein